MKTLNRTYTLSPYYSILRDEPLLGLTTERLEIYFDDLYHVFLKKFADLHTVERIDATEEGKMIWLLGQLLDAKRVLASRKKLEVKNNG